MFRTRPLTPVGVFHLYEIGNGERVTYSCTHNAFTVTFFLSNLSFRSRHYNLHHLWRAGCLSSVISSFTEDGHCTCTNKYAIHFRACLLPTQLICSLGLRIAKKQLCVSATIRHSVFFVCGIHLCMKSHETHHWSFSNRVFPQLAHAYLWRNIQGGVQFISFLDHVWVQETLVTVSPLERGAYFILDFLPHTHVWRRKVAKRITPNTPSCVRRNITFAPYIWCGSKHEYFITFMSVQKTYSRLWCSVWATSIGYTLSQNKSNSEQSCLPKPWHKSSSIFTKFIDCFTTAKKNRRPHRCWYTVVATFRAWRRVCGFALIFWANKTTRLQSFWVWKCVLLLTSINFLTSRFSQYHLKCPSCLSLIPWVLCRSCNLYTPFDIFLSHNTLQCFVLALWFQLECLISMKLWIDNMCQYSCSRIAHVMTFFIQS